MKVKAFAAWEAKDFDGLEWEDILQIIPMGYKAIVLVKDQAGRRNVLETSKIGDIDPLMETYDDAFDKRCKEALYDDFGGTEKIRFSYKESDTQHIDDVRIVYYEGGRKNVAVLDLTKRPETYKYITFSSDGDEL